MCIRDSLKAELKNPEMRRLMQLPGMRVQDAYRLAHYEDALRTTDVYKRQPSLGRPVQPYSSLMRYSRPSPSSVFDNPALLANDPGYLASLASLPEAEKQALLLSLIHI